MKSKQKSSSTMTPVRGGSTKMLGKMSAGPVKPGCSMGHQNGGGKFASGGGHKMVGKQTSKPAKVC